MSDAAGRARDLLADPPIGVEVWGPIVEGLLGELERTKTGRRHVEIAKMSWRDMAAAAGVEWNDDNPSMVQDITETIACTRADLAKARTVIERAREHLWKSGPFIASDGEWSYRMVSREELLAILAGEVGDQP